MVFRPRHILCGAFALVTCGAVAPVSLGTEEVAFEIRLGDAVSDQVPRRGAGNIETAGDHDVYRFEAAPGTVVYFDELAAGRDVRWHCRDALGKTIFDDATMSVIDPGLICLEAGGVYTITVLARGQATGTYAFRLWEVPAGATNISLETPISGAVDAGTMDVYTLDVAPGARVYFDERESGCHRWECLDEHGRTLFSDAAMCSSDPGVILLERGGTYTITVAGDGTAGSYLFVVRHVARPDTFMIDLDEIVAEGVQGIGAGLIEAPGATDVFILMIGSPKNVCFEPLEGSCHIVWTCADADETPIFRDDPLCLNQPRRMRLDRRGRYTITVSSRRTGPYAFVVSDAGDAELTGDCSVDLADLLALLSAWGSASADVTGDGRTDAIDLALLLSECG